MTTANGDAAATRPADPGDPLDALFRAPRDRFVTLRNALVKQLRTAGDASGAAQVRALTKPNVSAWAVNQLWWTRRTDVEALLEAGRRQAKAVRSAAGPTEHATAGQARRRALGTLMDAATEILTTAGNAATMATLRRISTTLEALAAHGVREGGPHPGRLSADLDPPGFELLGVLAAGSAEPQPAAPVPSPTAMAAQDEARTHAEAVVAAARAARDAAHDLAQDSARMLDQVIAARDEALLAASEAQDVLARAHTALAEATRAAESAELAARRTKAHAAREQQRTDQARGLLEARNEALRSRDETLHDAQRQRAALDEAD